MSYAIQGALPNLVEWRLQLGQRVINVPSSKRSFQWERPGVRVLALALVRLARWRSLGKAGLPKMIPIYLSNGGGQAAITFENTRLEAARSQPRTLWLADMLSISQSSKEAVQQLEQWFSVSNPQLRRRNELSTVSAHADSLPPTAITVLVDGLEADGSDLDRLEHALASSLDGSCPPLSLSPSVDIRGYFRCYGRGGDNMKDSLDEITDLMSEKSSGLIVLESSEPEMASDLLSTWVHRRVLDGELNGHRVIGWSYDPALGLPAKDELSRLSLANIGQDLPTIICLDRLDAISAEEARLRVAEILQNSPTNVSLIATTGRHLPELMEQAGVRRFAIHPHPHRRHRAVESMSRTWKLEMAMKTLLGAKGKAMSDCLHMLAELWDATTTRVLQALATFGENATRSSLAHLLEEVHPGTECVDDALHLLVQNKMLKERHEGGMELLPKIASFISENMRRSSPELWVRYHLALMQIKRSTNLLEAVRHGCLAGHHQAAARLLLGDDQGHLVAMIHLCKEVEAREVLSLTESFVFHANGIFNLEGGLNHMTLTALMYGRATALAHVGYVSESESISTYNWSRQSLETSNQGELVLAATSLLRSSLLVGTNLKGIRPTVSALALVMFNRVPTLKRLNMAGERTIAVEAIALLGVLAAVCLWRLKHQNRSRWLLRIVHRTCERMMGQPVSVFLGEAEEWRQTLLQEMRSGYTENFSLD